MAAYAEEPIYLNPEHCRICLADCGVELPAAAGIDRERVERPSPVLLHGFDSEAEGIAAANDTEYGLAAYVYTQSLDRALRAAEGIRAGMVGVNRGVAHHVSHRHLHRGHRGLR